MLDPKLLRQNLEFIVSGLSKRSFNLDIKFLTNSEEKRKILQLETEELRAQRNQKSREIGASKAKGIDTRVLQDAVTVINTELKDKEDELEMLSSQIEEFLQVIPNIPHESVPNGNSEQDNKVIESVGQPRQFEFEPKDHGELGMQRSGIDFANAAKIAGSRFVILRGEIAKLQRSLIQFMLDLHVEQHGYDEVYVPFLVNQDALTGTGQLPKFKEDLFSIENGKFFLGHDFNQFEIDKKFLLNSKIWCHAKTNEALIALDQIKAHYFWHQEDDYTITSKGYIWTYPGKKILPKSICVLPERVNYKKIDCLGICSDFIGKYK